VTFPRSLADTPTAARGRYPRERPRAVYGEGRLLGYRWYDARRVHARYRFGFGRSYATFAYRDLSVGGTRVSFSVLNRSRRTGTAVPQIYLRLPSAPLRLAGFSRLEIGAGGRARVNVDLPARSLQVWRRGRWVRPPGRIEVTVRTDAQTVKLRGNL
jgi:beta-glucosidase